MTEGTQPQEIQEGPQETKEVAEARQELDQATHDAPARVEATQSFEQVEKTEEEFKAVVDAVAAQAVETAAPTAREAEAPPPAESPDPVSPMFPASAIGGSGVSMGSIDEAKTPVETVGEASAGGIAGRNSNEAMPPDLLTDQEDANTEGAWDFTGNDEKNLSTVADNLLDVQSETQQIDQNGMEHYFESERKDLGVPQESPPKRADTPTQLKSQEASSAVAAEVAEVSQVQRGDVPEQTEAPTLGGESTGEDVTETDSSKAGSGAPAADGLPTDDNMDKSSQDPAPLDIQELTQEGMVESYQESEKEQPALNPDRLPKAISSTGGDSNAESSSESNSQAEPTGKTSFGDPSPDPARSYSRVEMAEGEVLQDSDWNETEENDPEQPIPEGEEFAARGTEELKENLAPFKNNLNTLRQMVAEIQVDNYGNEGNFEDAIKAWEEKLNSVGDDAELADIDLQGMLEEQQELINTLLSMGDVGRETAEALIKKTSVGLTSPAGASETREKGEVQIIIPAGNSQIDFAGAVSEVSKIDSFTWKLSVAKDETGDFRIPSLHNAEIDPLPERTASGDHLETPGDAADLNLTEKQDPPAYDPDLKPEKIEETGSSSGSPTLDQLAGMAATKAETAAGEIGNLALDQAAMLEEKESIRDEQENLQDQLTFRMEEGSLLVGEAELIDMPPENNLPGDDSGRNIDESDYLSKLIESLQKRKEEIVGEIDSVNQEISQLTDEIFDIEIDIPRWEELIRDSHDWLGMLTSDLEMLENELGDLEEGETKTISFHTGEYSEGDLNSTDFDWNEQTMDMDRQMILAKIADHKQTIVDVKQLIEIGEEEIQNIKTGINIRKEQIEENKNKINGLRRALDSINQEINQVMSEILITDNKDNHDATRDVIRKT